MRRISVLTTVLVLFFGAANLVAAQTRVSVLSLGVSDQLGVFAREAEQAGAALKTYFGPETRLVIRTNRKERPEALPARLPAAFAEASAGLDRERDLLVVFLTAHGTRAGLEVRADRRSETFTPRELGAMLAATGMRRRIVVVSACYSGVFAEHLAGPETLVMTASDAWHPSFGCKPGARWTFFGEALFAKAMQQGLGLPEIYRLAAADVLRREQARKLKPSNPQFAGGAVVLAALAGEKPPEVAQASPAGAQGCNLRPEPARENPQCLVFNGYSGGALVGHFRLASKQGPRPVAAGGSCAPEMPAGTLLSPERLKVGSEVFTLFPDCRGSAKTSD